MGNTFGAEGQVPPYSQDAEIAVLGSILLNDKVIHVVDGIIEPSDFYVKAHRKIFEAMRGLANEGTAVDYVTLGNRLRATGDLEEIGGAIALSGLTDAVATSVNVDHYAGIVREAAAIRRVIYAAQTTVSSGLVANDVVVVADSVTAIVEASHYLARTRMPKSIFGLADGVIDLYKKVAGGYRGIPFPWPTLDAMTAGMWSKTLTMFVARPGTGKCLHANTLTYIPTTGQYKTIEQVVKDRNDVLTRNSDGSIVPVTPDAWLAMGEKECLRVKMYSGREMSQTPEHPMMTVDGWKRTDRIEIGDYVEAVGFIPEPTEVISVDDSESMLIGMMLADGGVTQGQPTFTKGDIVIVDHVRWFCLVHGSKLVQMTLGKADGRYRINGSSFWKKWDSWGCDRSLSKNKTIPDRVFQYDNESLAKFLGALWSCDGSFPFVGGKSGRKGSCTIEIGLASKVMIEQLQRLFLRFGIHGRVRHKNVKLQGKMFDSWVYKVYSTSFNKFRRMIPIIGSKASKAAKLLDSVNPNVDNIPVTPALKVELLRIVNQYGDTERVGRYDSMSRALGMTSRISVNKLYRRETVSRRIFGAFLDAFEAEHLRHLTVNHWDRVESVGFDGVHRVYDLTVDSSHAFVANDMVVHNTFVAIIAGRHAWLEDNRVLIVSPEMSKEEIAERFFVIESGVSYRDVIHGQLSDFALPLLENVVAKAPTLDNLWVMDAEDDLSPKGIEAAIRACRPHLVCVDSIYDLKIRGNRQERALGALEWMKGAAKRLDFACCGFAQQNRTAELSERKGGGSRLGTIALADEIGQDAHAVFALEQSKDDKADKVLKIRPLKLRRGQMSRDLIRCNWDFDAMKYDEIPEDEDEFSDDEEIPF